MIALIDTTPIRVRVTNPNSLNSPGTPPAALPMTPTTVTLLALVGALLTVMSNLGTMPLHDWDEAWHARIALEIAREGTWLNFTENGDITTAAVKPPLYFWGMATAFRLLGPTEFAARLFSALCYLATVVLVTRFCLRHGNWTVALVAAFLLSTNRLLVYQHGARAAEIDPPLVLFLTLVMIGTWRLQRGGRPWWLPLAWAGALLTKGVAALQVLPAIVLWLLIWRAWRALGWSMLWFAIGCAPLAVFIVIRTQHQPEVMELMFGRETVGRVLADIDGTQSGPLFYVRRVAIAWTPLIVALVLTIVATRGRPQLTQQLAEPRTHGPLLTLLLLWWLVPFILFSIAETRRTWYVYPSLVPACILAAWTLRAGLAQMEARGGRHVGPVVAFLVLVGMGVPAVWHSLVPQASDAQRAREYQALVRAATSVTSDEEVILYRTYPSERFYLARAGVRYAVEENPDRLATSLRTARSPVLLIYPERAAATIAPLLQSPNTQRRATLEMRAVHVDVIQPPQEVIPE